MIIIMYCAKLFTLYTAALAIVVELLEYCDEYEESREAGNSDTEMEEGRP